MTSTETTEPVSREQTGGRKVAGFFVGRQREHHSPSHSSPDLTTSMRFVAHSGPRQVGSL
jgi:hypothetical protein